MQPATEGRFTCDVAVVGSALAGMVAALALAESGAAVALIGPRPDAAAIERDTRSTALFGPSLILLDHLKLDKSLTQRAQKLSGLRLVDATDRLIRAPEVLFEAHELGLEMFGLNFENADLLRALSGAVTGHPRIAWRSGLATGFAISEATAEIILAGGERLTCRLLVGADGAASVTRRAAGIGAQAWSYPQVAIASRFGHSRPHLAVSTELHRRAGPLTTVPLPGNNSSLVWVET
ncbi:MAG: FAD-dependent monooxygenase, partial [Proteobacteria bacterium]|nr:FAD-dependent monooxygenase [Pseudomonadota bacterium]